MKKEKLTDAEKKNLKKAGKRLKELRIKAGYKSSELFAYENDFSRAQYAKYEAGANITLVTLMKILKAMNVTLREFFKEID